MAIHENEFLKSWIMGSNIYPTVGGGVLEPKNVNCEGGMKCGTPILCRHILDSSKNQSTTGMSLKCKGGISSHRPTQESCSGHRGSRPANMRINNRGAWRYISVE